MPRAPSGRKRAVYKNAMATPTTEPKSPAKRAEREAREARLAETLRANLRRRKDAALARDKAASPDAATGPDTP